jgi:hypothetical protein
LVLIWRRKAFARSRFAPNIARAQVIKCDARRETRRVGCIRAGLLATAGKRETSRETSKQKSKNET